MGMTKKFDLTILPLNRDKDYSLMKSGKKICIKSQLV